MTIKRKPISPEALDQVAQLLSTEAGWILRGLPSSGQWIEYDASNLRIETKLKLIV